MDEAHRRPSAADDRTIEALGKLSEAFEVVEEARGLLYAFHRRCGRADLTLGEAVSLLHNSGHTDLADDLRRTLVGRNVLPDRWSYEVVEEYDATYYEPFRAAEVAAREELAEGKRHVFEAEMKARERQDGPGDDTGDG
ncbi:hypothetical protein [Janibacter alittae]|uniref:Uncharacterized protein n=1 Tax=Janibacter alittae TaxID=3115209 RepID=A0ABZ2MI83_9MICO